ncbi:MAG: hypothetical protein ACP6IY_00720 [Promethearchaeia archaeon]
MIKKIRKSLKIKGIFSMLFIIIFLNTIYISYAGISYNYTIQKGTDCKTVIIYNEDKWKNVVGTQKPTEYFGGEADKVNARNKQTYLALYDSKWKLSDFLITMNVLGGEILTVATLLNYTIDDIDSKFSKNYNIWVIYANYWNFNTSNFEEKADYPNKEIPIIKNPDDLKSLLNDYNNLIELFNYTYLQTINSDDFLFKLVLSGLSIPSPINTYLKELTESLGCKSVKVNDNEIKFEKSGNENYYVEFIFGNNGLIDSISFSDSNGEIFYKIINQNSNIIPIIILCSIGIFLIGIIIYQLRKKRKREEYLIKLIEKK